MKETLNKYGRFIILLLVILAFIGLIFGGIWFAQLRNTTDSIMPDAEIEAAEGTNIPVLNVQNQNARINMELKLIPVESDYDEFGNYIGTTPYLFSATDMNGLDISKNIIVIGSDEFDPETGIFCATKSGKYNLKVSVTAYDGDGTTTGGKPYTISKRIIITVDDKIDRFVVNVITSEHGAFSASPAFAKEKAHVRFSYKPDTGYYLSEIEYTYYKENNGVKEPVTETLPGTANAIIMPASDITLKPVWLPAKYMVTLNANSGTLSGNNSFQVTFDAPYGEMNEPVREGYTFAGWFTEKDSGEEVTAETIVKTAKAHTLYAHWNINQYTITYKLDNSSTIYKTQTVTYGSRVGSNEGYPQDPTKEGTSFIGWVLDSDENAYISKTTQFKYTHNITVIAKWKAKPVTVTLDANGGTVNIKTLKLYLDEPYGDLPSPTLKGSAFVGWYTAADGGNIILPNDKVTSTNNFTIYAHWSKNNYTVTFNPMNNTNSNNFQTINNVHYNETIPGLNGIATPTYDGRTFLGWYTAPQGGLKVTDAYRYQYTYNTTFYAHWSDKQVSVKFFDSKNNNDTPVYQYNFTVGKSYGAIIDKLSSIMDTRYSDAFTGWFTEKTGGNQITAATIVSENITKLYAHWESQKSISVSFYVLKTDIAKGGYSSPFDSDDNETNPDYVVSTAAYRAGEDNIDLPVPFLENYTFDSWITEPNGQGTKVKSSNDLFNLPTQNNIVLYASWSENGTGGVQPGSIIFFSDESSRDEWLRNKPELKENVSGGKLGSYYVIYDENTILSDYTGNSNITRVKCDSTVVEIANDAFSGCSNLRQLGFTEDAEATQSILTVKENAFKDTNIAKLELPAFYESLVLGDCAFAQTNYSENTNGPLAGNTTEAPLVITENIATLPISCFENTNIQGVEIHDAIDGYKENVFAGCKDLEYVKMPCNVPISDGMFYVDDEGGGIKELKITRGVNGQFPTNFDKASAIKDTDNYSAHYKIGEYYNYSDFCDDYLKYICQIKESNSTYEIYYKTIIKSENDEPTIEYTNRVSQYGTMPSPYVDVYAEKVGTSSTVYKKVGYMPEFKAAGICNFCNDLNRQDMIKNISSLIVDDGVLNIDYSFESSNKIESLTVPVSCNILSVTYFSTSSFHDPIFSGKITDIRLEKSTGLNAQYSTGYVDFIKTIKSDSLKNITITEQWFDADGTAIENISTNNIYARPESIYKYFSANMGENWDNGHVIHKYGTNLKNTSEYQYIYNPFIKNKNVSLCSLTNGCVLTASTSGNGNELIITDYLPWNNSSRTKIDTVITNKKGTINPTETIVSTTTDITGTQSLVKNIVIGDGVLFAYPGMFTATTSEPVISSTSTGAVMSSAGQTTTTTTTTVYTGCNNIESLTIPGSLIVSSLSDHFDKMSFAGLENLENLTITKGINNGKCYNYSSFQSVTAWRPNATYKNTKLQYYDTACNTSGNDYQNASFVSFSDDRKENNNAVPYSYAPWYSSNKPLNITFADGVTAIGNHMFSGSYELPTDFEYTLGTSEIKISSAWKTDETAYNIHNAVNYKRINIASLNISDTVINFGEDAFKYILWNDNINLSLPIDAYFISPNFCSNNKKSEEAITNEEKSSTFTGVFRNGTMYKYGKEYTINGVKKTFTDFTNGCTALQNIDDNDKLHYKPAIEIIKPHYNLLYYPIILQSVKTANITFTPGTTGIGIDYDSSTYLSLPWIANGTDEQTYRQIKDYDEQNTGSGTRQHIVNISFEDGIKHIGDYMFFGCRALTNIEKLPSSLETIGSGAFINASLKKVGTITEVPIFVKEFALGDNFNADSFLQLPAIYSNNISVTENNTKYSVKDIKISKISTSTATDKYGHAICTADGKKLLFFIHPDGDEYKIIETPDTYKNIRIIIPDEITSVGQYAFYSYQNIEAIKAIGVTTCDKYAFAFKKYKAPKFRIDSFNSSLTKDDVFGTDKTLNNITIFKPDENSGSPILGWINNNSGILIDSSADNFE